MNYSNRLTRKLQPILVVIIQNARVISSDEKLRVHFFFLYLKNISLQDKWNIKHPIFLRVPRDTHTHTHKSFTIFLKVWTIRGLSGFLFAPGRPAFRVKEKYKIILPFLLKRDLKRLKRNI